MSLTPSSLLDDLRLDPASDQPMYRQLASAFEWAIREGRLRPEMPLPGTRTVAERLGVSRNVAIAAYQELLSQGWIECAVSYGTRVASTLPQSAPTPPSPQAATGPSYGFDLPSRLAPLGDPAPARQVLDLRGHTPDARSLPSAELARAYRRALDRHRPDDLARAHPKGHAGLRACVAQHLGSERGLPPDPDRLLLTGGLSESLALPAAAFLRPGEVAPVEAPRGRRTWEAFELAGARVVPLPVDEGGLVVETLAQRLNEGPIRLLHLTPSGQNPTGVLLAPERREALLDLARTHRVAVLEDDSLGEMQFAELPQEPLAARDRHGVVVLLGTLAPILGTSLRLGWVRGPRSLVDRLATLRGRADYAGAWVAEDTLRDLFLDGWIARLARKGRVSARERRNHLLELWRSGTGQAPAPPAAGLALWAPVPEGTDALAWAARAARAGILVEPGRSFDHDLRNLNRLQIGYGSLEPGEMTEAMARLLAVRN